MDTNTIDRKIERLRAEYQAAVRQCKAERKALKRAIQRLKAVQGAQAIAQAVATQVQKRAHKQIAGVVGACLRGIFDREYDFRIDFVRKRGKTAANLQLIHDGHIVGNPLEEDSGGVLDTAGAIQRVSCLRLHKPPLRALLALDEPFKNLHSPTYRANVRMMLEKLSREFNIQFIIVTGISDFEMGKVIRL